jgi:putative transposase
MARPLRIEFPGEVYQVTSRGDRRDPIFVDEWNAGLCWMCWHRAWSDLTAARWLRRLRSRRSVGCKALAVGHLFKGRFKTVLVDRDSYLLEVCRYVELSPVRAGMAAAPGDWHWSSCAALTGQAPCPPWLDRASMWGYLLGETAGTDALAKDFARRAGQAYADLVAAGKDVSRWPDHLRQQRYLGDEAFVLRMQELASDRAVSNKEMPKAPRASPKTLQDWLALMPCRNEAIVTAYRHSQLNMSDIAPALGL